MPNPFSSIWTWWKKFAHGLALVQTRIIMTVFYFFFLGIVSLLARLLRANLLDTSFPSSAGAWEQRERGAPDMGSCRRQF